MKEFYGDWNAGVWEEIVKRDNRGDLGNEQNRD